jgi:mono/diheme cytochrome c family protein
MSGGAGGTTGGNVAAGQMVYGQCSGCHGTAAEGVTSVGPNITGSAQGIGSWTQAQFNNAMRMGVDDTGRMLCRTMPRYNTLTDTQLTDLLAFLKSQMSSARPMLASGCGAP